MLHEKDSQSNRLGEDAIWLSSARELGVVWTHSGVAWNIQGLPVAGRSTRKTETMAYTWDFATVLSRSDLLLEGAKGTLQATGLSLAIAVPLGVFIALMRVLPNPVVSRLAVAYIDFFRSSSQFVLVFWFFYAFPILVHLDLDALAAGAMAIAAHFSALFAEVFRAGITSINKGQWEGAKAMGLSRSSTLRYVILPQALRRIFPIFFSQIIELTKATSFLSALGYGELSYNAARIASATYRPLETFVVVGLIYFVPIFLVSQCVRAYERRSSYLRG
jgi:polar amino acid transport system permease protein